MTVEPALSIPVSARWLHEPASLLPVFLAAEPFPLLVLDDFLEDGFAHELVAEFPRVDIMPRSRDYVFGKKHELSSIEGAGPASTLFHMAMTSEMFRSFLHEATGFDLFVDPSFHGGGFHQGADGSFLDMHVDFNVHPLHPDWLRTLNILLYLNPRWDEAWGGHLLVKKRPEEEARAIAPLFNRAVIMLTHEHTYHGYRMMRLPPGITRRSIATYAYRQVAEGEVTPRTTGWAPEHAGPLKRFFARHYDTLVRAKNRWLGSGTAHNR